MRATQQIHVRGTEPLISPRDLLKRYPMTESVNRLVVESREAVTRILKREDPRLMLIVGPCSIHDPKAAIEYAGRLHGLSERVKDQLLVIMRVYFEKPRTIMGWKGLINDPQLDGTLDIAEGLARARQILLEVGELGLPVATEMLDPITPQYTADLVTWASIGARTIESQTHRQMASGLSMPVGYKNATNGDLTLAINAMQSAHQAHSFLGIDEDGQTCIIHTTGNPDGHLILRGGGSGPNYDAANVAKAIKMLEAAGLKPNVLIDCSHANSGKDHRRQGTVMRDVLRQRAEGNHHIVGMMLESNLEAGSQSLPEDPSQLKYGVSITDACIGWDETEKLLLHAHEVMSRLRPVGIS